MSNWVANLMAACADAFRVLERRFGPLLDLAIRLWLAQSFFVSGVLKVANWDTALYLSANEYPVTWLDPAIAAVLGVSVELAGSVLLAAGLATRLAAVPMLALTLIIQINYRALDTHLIWAALFAWFTLRGAGPLSLDHLLARGLGDTAVPLAARAARMFTWITHNVFPGYQLLLRLWLAMALLVAEFAPLAARIAPAEPWLPVSGAASLFWPLAGALALLLAVGLATRFVAVSLLASAIAMAMVASGSAPEWHWSTLLGLLLAFGPGALSLDALIARRSRRAFPQLDGRPAFSLQGLPRVVIVGAGFGGLACARGLSRAKVQVTLIDRNNYHLFQPLLYQVATAGLAPGDIAAPVRGLFREQFNARVLLGAVTGVDTRTRRVLLGETSIDYDYLVLGTGASHSYFGRDDWAPHAPGLKRIEDATDVRRRVLTAFEHAEACEDDAQRRALLTFLIVGGGPTGVELAGAIAELARFGMEKDFRRFDPAGARVILVQAAERILPTFPAALSAHAEHALRKLGVEVIKGSRVEAIDELGVTVNGKRIAARTVLWAAGVVASPAANWLAAAADQAGRIKVGDDLSVPGLPDVFAVGDTAASSAWNGRPVPGLAPAAKQGGEYVASVIRSRVAGRPRPAPFRYRHPGSLATIGRKAAVADFGRVRIAGAAAWWLWGLVHLGFLVGVRNRVSVMFDWFWAYLTLRSGTRLITGAPAAAGAAPLAPAPIRLKSAAV
jgi:putative oxidoreductase